MNGVRRPQSPGFTKGFLMVTPGITIRDTGISTSRLVMRVLDLSDVGTGGPAVVQVHDMSGRSLAMPGASCSLPHI
jgi:hypothetical protein